MRTSMKRRKPLMKRRTVTTSGSNQSNHATSRRKAVRFGPLTIEPVLRRVAHDDGREALLEPRVMQVLVALIHAGGRILTRDDLLLSCWSGVVVGEDAINRVIGRLRRLADGLGDGAFKLETITKVGYRLVSTALAAASDPAPAPAEPLLAVLAFENLCDGEDMAWFSDGVSEEILQTVARSAALKVIGRGSSFQFRGADKAAAHISATLKATHVLDGSVRRAGSTVRIAAHLIECAGETTLWSDRFDRELSDIFAAQEEIAAAVAAALKTTFAPDSKPRKVSPVAYDLYLKACAPSSEAIGSHAEAIYPLERAVSLAPQFAPAWGALAHARAIVNRGISVDEHSGAVARMDAVVAAEMALSLDSGCTTALLALAQLLPWGDYRGRESLIKEALRATPHNPQAMVDMAWLLTTVGRNEEALGQAAAALALDPLNRGAANCLWQLLIAVGRYEEGQRSNAVYRGKWPAAAVFIFAPMALAALAGDWMEFDRLAVAIEAYGHSGPHVDRTFALGKMLRDPNPARRERILAILGRQQASRGAAGFVQLLIADKMGLRDEVFALIEKASFDHLLAVDGPAPAEIASPGIILDKTLNRSMMEDRRFVRFCSKIGLCDYWIQTDRWPDCAKDGALPYDFKSEVRRLTEKVSRSLSSP